MKRAGGTLPIILGVVLLAALAGWYASGLGRPSDTSVREAARQLVPPGAAVARDTAVSGEPLIVGPFQGHVEFTGGAPSEETLPDIVTARATALGWREIGRDVRPGATIITFTRDQLEVRVHAARRGRVGGEIYSKRTGTGTSRRATFTLGAAAVGGGLAAAVARRRRPSRH